MAARYKPGLDPVTAIRVKLDAVSGRLANAQTPVDEAVAELRGIAQSRGDLLAEVAGGLLGRFLADPASSHPARPLAVAYLVLAGADPDHLPEHVDETRARFSRPTHGASSR